MRNTRKERIEQEEKYKKWEIEIEIEIKRKTVKIKGGWGRYSRYGLVGFEKDMRMKKINRIGEAMVLGGFRCSAVPMMWPLAATHWTNHAHTHTTVAGEKKQMRF